ncbi:MAG: acetylxylan esterase, partial [Terriglobia bacterium]
MPGDTKADTPRAFLILCLGVVCVALLSSTGPCWADETLATRLGNLDATVLAEEPKRAGMLADDVRARRAKANLRETALWHKIQTRRDWEQFRDARIHALHGSLGQFPPVPKELQVRLARTLAGDGYRIDNLVFESRPGLFVTANLYRPSDPRDSMPGILLCHSHHNPKTQAELQDMGMTWARLGCIVLVMDQLGHGERRQHSFRSRDDYPGEFRVGRQDYHFRYNVGMQLHLIGDSLIGWMVWDLMRGVDLLLDWAGADPQRIILLGSVAGGGDPVAVTAALDRRIAAVVPFNFGGPQPENRYPLPPDAERSFNYAGSGSWESTRNLRLSVRDGFMPWVIVGAVAPR